MNIRLSVIPLEKGNEGKFLSPPCGSKPLFGWNNNSTGFNYLALFEKYVIRRAAVKENLKFAKKSCLVKPSLKSPQPPFDKGGQGGFGRAMVLRKILGCWVRLCQYTNDFPKVPDHTLFEQSPLFVSKRKGQSIICNTIPFPTKKQSEHLPFSKPTNLFR
jgi:hypothetical protein